MAHSLPIINIQKLVIKDYKNLKEGKIILTIPETLSFYPGDVIYILGGNGKGKSVFLKYLTGNLKDFIVKTSHSSEKSLYFPFGNNESNLSHVYPSTTKLFDEHQEKLLLNTMSVFLGKDNYAPKTYNLSLSIRYLFNNIEDEFIEMNRAAIIKNLLELFNDLKKNDLLNLKAKNLKDLIFNLAKNESIYSVKTNYMMKYKRFVLEDNIEKKVYGKSSLFETWLSKIPFIHEFLDIKEIDSSNFYKLKNRYLSGGQSQALSVFQTILFADLMQTTVTVFDEPLNFLDIENRAYMVSQIEDYTFNRSNPNGVVFLVSHPASIFSPDFRFFNPLIHHSLYGKKSNNDYEIDINSLKNQILKVSKDIENDDTGSISSKLDELLTMLKIFKNNQDYLEFIKKHSNRNIRVLYFQGNEIKEYKQNR